ncbi:MAG TPA: class I SAM-dependent methyltransferase [Candidatus Diapherotrites archaeon]|uniref:Class I SAM-dependent methyltransferase n=1 Tax=Candidatus Iainarchaeum sp. TaxID=3101447 RepID=A0A7J4J1J0_9ARCH|nr:class I SAM-dependent methyltransferase [Candidatus Diapherotrites archaeon]
MVPANFEKMPRRALRRSSREQRVKEAAKKEMKRRKEARKIKRNLLGELIKGKRPVGLSYYEKCFGFKDADIIGKRILEVGAGHALFSQEAESVGAKVVLLDPTYAGKADRRIQELSKTNKLVAGMIQKLPVKENSFDIAFARTVIPDRVKGPELYESVIELLRVVKKGGWAGIGPFRNVGESKFFIRMKDFLQKAGFGVYVKRIDVPIGKQSREDLYFKVWNSGNIDSLKAEARRKKR